MTIYLKALGRLSRAKCKLLLNIQSGGDLVDNDLVALQNLILISARKSYLKVNIQM